MASKRPPQGKRAARRRTSHDDAFTISATAGFDPEGVWVIRVTADFRDAPPPPESDLLAQARLGALIAMGHAGIEGRKLGATEVRVILDLGDGPRMIVPGLDSTTLH